MTVAILGSPFDPIHNGHLQLAEYASEYVDDVFFMPCYSHQFGKKMADKKHRLEMLRLATANNDRYHVFEFEIKNKLTGSTYENLSKLKSIVPDFYFIIGGDNAENIHLWKEWEKLISEFKFIIVPRGGFEPKLEWYRQQPHIFIDKKTVDAASTDIRKSFKTKSSETSTMILKEVAEYIQKNGLYQ